MDTRNKILTIAAACALPRGEMTVASGYFDGLRAAHVHDLAGLPRPLLAAVLPPASELLNARARAEMVAALRIIDYVVIVNERELDALIGILAPPRVARLESSDLLRTRRLIEHVRSRQS